MVETASNTNVPAVGTQNSPVSEPAASVSAPTQALAAAPSVVRALGPATAGGTPAAGSDRPSDPPALAVVRTVPAPGIPAAVPSPRAPAVVPPLPAIRVDRPKPAGPAPAAASRFRRRHFGLLATFLVVVVAPVLVSAWYLWARAADQFASTLGFSVHREGMNSGLSILSGLSSLSGSSSSDTDIIFNFLNSQQLVSEIDDEVDLRAMWSKPEADPVFTFDPEDPIEDLVDYWKRMVNVYYDSTTRLIEVRVLAFAPEDARRIAEVIFDKSTFMINQLNRIAAEDAVKFTAEELEITRRDLTVLRQEVTEFRNKNQFVDPASDVLSQTTIISTLEQQLASAMIELDLLRENAKDSDPRLPPLESRIRVIEDRIKAERGKIGSPDDPAFANIVAEYERLVAERLFAESAYQAAKTAHEVARVEARRQSRYLAPHILPTLAETSRYPERLTKLAVIAAFLLMIWSIGTLVYYSLRDRR